MRWKDPELILMDQLRLGFLIRCVDIPASSAAAPAEKGLMWQNYFCGQLVAPTELDTSADLTPAELGCFGGLTPADPCPLLQRWLAYSPLHRCPISYRRHRTSDVMVFGETFTMIKLMVCPSLFYFIFLGV